MAIYVWNLSTEEGNQSCNACAAEVGYITQGVNAAFDPLRKVVVQMVGTSRTHEKHTILESLEEPLLKLKMSKRDRYMRSAEVMAEVELAEEYLGRYPHALSGGQLQRVCIARAIIQRPSFIVLDEVVNRLDIETKLKLLDLLHRIKEKHQLTYLFITHDIDSAKYIADEIVVMEDGAIVERI